MSNWLLQGWAVSTVVISGLEFCLQPVPWSAAVQAVKSDSVRGLSTCSCGKTRQKHSCVRADLVAVLGTHSHG